MRDSFHTHIKHREHARTHASIHLSLIKNHTSPVLYCETQKCAQMTQLSIIIIIITVIIIYLMNGERKKIVYNIFLFHMINKCGESSPTSLFHKGITFLRVCVWCFFGCAFDLYIYLLIIFEELLRSTRYTVAITANITHSTGIACA